MLLLDELLGALDARTRMVLQEQLSKLVETSGTTAIFGGRISIEEAILLADKIIGRCTARPGRVCDQIDVTPPRPQSLATTHEPEYAVLFDRIYGMLRDEVMRAMVDRARGMSMTPGHRNRCRQLLPPITRSPRARAGSGTTMSVSWLGPGRTAGHPREMAARITGGVVVRSAATDAIVVVLTGDVPHGDLTLRPGRPCGASSPASPGGGRSVASASGSPPKRVRAIADMFIAMLYPGCRR